MMQSTLTVTHDGRMPYFAALDGVRTYCILLVMFDHLKTNGHSLTWLNGHLGVDLFFIVSGFLITTLLTRERFFNGRIDFPAFYWRRFFRIIPAYAATLLLYVAILQLPSQAAKWAQFKAAVPWFLTLMNEFAQEPQRGSVFMHTWSLGVEEKFYLVWPVLFFVIPHTTRGRFYIVATLFVEIAIAPLFGHGYLARAYFGLLMGCMMAVALSCRYAPRIFAALRRTPPLAALGFFLAGFYAEHLSKNLMFLFSAGAVFFVSFLISHDCWLSRLHSAAAVVWLGKRSYSMYLIHVLCLNAIETRVHIDSGVKAFAALIVAFVLTAAAAEVLYCLVEQPCREFGRRYLARHREVAQAV